MKKTAFILGGIFLISIALTSCKKDYVCQCKDSSGTTTDVTLSNTTKKLATDACNVYEIGGLTCDLK